MGAEPLIHREEVTGIMWALADLIAEVKAIRRLLEDDGEEEEEADA